MNIKTIQKLIFILFASSSTNLLAGGCGTGSGMIILDNTETPGVVAIGANLGFTCGGKSVTAIDDGYGGNAINISDFHVLQRKINKPGTDELQLFIGKSDVTVSDFKFGTENQLNFFAEGSHLFDLDRLRVASDWIKNNVTPDAGVTTGTYGTISMNQFLANIAAGKTMYGMVRVIVPLEAGQSSSTLNALEETVVSGSLYGFCAATNNLCSCAPGKKGFGDIGENKTLCGNDLPANARIMVKGSLFWDFVDSTDGHSLALSELPFVPRELYFKVKIPVMVNWAGDSTNDGAMDNADLVYNYSKNYNNTDILNETFLFSDVPDESKAQYLYDTGLPLTQARFDALDPATKYHAMLPSGYAEGWADAFDKLNITAEQWATIPGMSKPFRVPNESSLVLTADELRSDGFEDIPTYLYSGGLIDMHNHVNISGLVYVPQGMELEAKAADVRQYVSGAIITRDSFYIEAKPGTVTIISSDPSSYSAVRVAPPSNGAGGSSQSDFAYKNSTFEYGSDDGGAGGGAADGSGESGGGTAGSVRWQEIRPQL